MTRRGTWLRPMVARAGLRAHYFPGHTPDDPFDGTEIARCGTPVSKLPPAAMRQAWRCPLGAPSTCWDCANGALEDAE